jgi:hypothetical protein
MTARGFNGSTQFLQSASFLSSPSYPVSIGAWFRTSNIGAGAYQRVAVYENGSGTGIIASLLLNYPGGGDLANQNYNGGNYLPSVSGITANRWHHGLAVCDATTSYIYLDGNPGSTSSVNTAPTSLTLIIGREANNVQFLSGAACEVVCWNAFLNVNDARDLHAGKDPLKIQPNKIIAAYLPRRGSPYYRTDKDAVGQYDITSYNSPTWEDEPAHIGRQRKRRRVGIAAAGAAKPVLFHAHYMSQGMRL